MSDQNKFVNSYIDNALGMSFEYMKQVVHLKTQLNIANDLVQQKDEVISALRSDSEKIKTDSNELCKAQEDVKRLEGECATLRNKVSHMDTLTNQFNQMKNDLINKQNDATRLQNDLNNLRNQDVAKDNEISKFKTEIDQLKGQVSQKDQEIVVKNEEIQSLKTQIDTLSKKPINSKIKQKPIVPDKVIESGDDF